MKYTIKELPTFSVIGLEQTLTEKKESKSGTLPIVLAVF